MQSDIQMVDYLVMALPVFLQLIIFFNSIMFLSLRILFVTCYLFDSLLAIITVPLSLTLLASLLRI